MALLKAQGIAQQRLRPLLNREDEPGELQVSSIDKALPMPVSYHVANDPQALQACVHLGLPLHEHAPGSPVLRDLRKMASHSLDLPVPTRRSWLGRWIGKGEQPLVS